MALGPSALALVACLVTQGKLLRMPPDGHRTRTTEHRREMAHGRTEGEATFDSGGDLSPTQAGVLQGVASTTGTLSALSSAFVVWATFRKGERRTFAERLVGHMAFADCLAAAFHALGRAPIGNDVACFVQGVGLQFFNVAAILWTTSLALNLYLAVRLEVAGGSDRALERRYQAGVWGSSAFMTGLVFAGQRGGYGDADLWCWIEEPVYRLLLFYTLVLGAVVTNGSPTARGGPCWTVRSISRACSPDCSGPLLLHIPQTLVITPPRARSQAPGTVTPEPPPPPDERLPSLLHSYLVLWACQPLA